MFSAVVRTLTATSNPNVTKSLNSIYPYHMKHLFGSDWHSLFTNE